MMTRSGVDHVQGNERLLIIRRADAGRNREMTQEASEIFFEYLAGQVKRTADEDTRRALPVPDPRQRADL